MPRWTISKFYFNSKFILGACCRWNIGNETNIPLLNGNWIVDIFPLIPQSKGKGVQLGDNFIVTKLTIQ
jgi:hypothetical protein